MKHSTTEGKDDDDSITDTVAGAPRIVGASRVGGAPRDRMALTVN